MMEGLIDSTLIVTGRPNHGKDTTATEIADILYEEDNITSQIIELSWPIQSYLEEVGWDGEKDINGRLALQLAARVGEEEYGKHYWISEALGRYARPSEHDLLIVTGLWSWEHRDLFATVSSNLEILKVKRFQDDTLSELYDDGSAKITANPYNVPDTICDYILRYGSDSGRKDEIRRFLGLSTLLRDIRQKTE